MHYQGQYQERPKTKEEIQQLHDLLHPLANAEIPLPNSITKHLSIMMVAIRSMLFALCWVLGHPSGKELHTTMQVIEKEMDDMGYELCKPMPGELGSNLPGTHFSSN